MKRAALLITLLCLVLCLFPSAAFALEGDVGAEGVPAEGAFANYASDNLVPNGLEEGAGAVPLALSEPNDEAGEVDGEAEQPAEESHDTQIPLVENMQQAGNESIIVQNTESEHDHEWSDWVQTQAPTYYVDGVETRTCQRDPVHVETRSVPAFGPAEDELADALSDGNYGNDVGVRLLYTRPVELHYRDDSDYESPHYYRTVPIDLSNPAIPENDVAVRYTGDEPYLVVVYMGNDNGWRGWTTVGASKVVATSDGTGQCVAIFSWAKMLEQWNRKFDDATSYQAKERAAGRPDPMFDMLSVAVSKGKSCSLTEVVSLSNTIHTTPKMRDVSENISAEELVEQLGAGFNFSGMFESHWKPDTPAKDGGWSQADINLEAHWSRGTYVTRQMIADVKARGFSAVRMPITWYQHIYEYQGDSYHIDRAWMQRVHEVVDWCLEEDLYVIINIHHEDWINRPDLDTAYDQTDLKRRFTAVWTQIAHEFDGYDQRLIFEDLNEPRASGADVDHEREWGTPWPGDVRTINNLHRDFIALMRTMPEASRHRERLIMTPLYSAGEAYPELHYVIPDDPSHMLAVSVHNYTPHNYTHYADGEKADLSDPDQWIDCVYSDSYREALFRSFESIRQRFTSKGVPVVLGEFGCYYHGETRQADRLAWMTDYITYAKQLGLPCFIWGMDRTTANNVKVWNVYDQNHNEWSTQSSALLDKWFEILADPTIQWGENALVAEDEHVPIESGIALAFGADANGVKHLYKDGLPNSETFRTGAIAATREMFNGKDVAVKFTGVIPYLAVCDSKWKGWTTIEPYYVDEAAGIAYFSEQSIDWRWSGKEGTVGANSDGTSYTIGPIGKLFVCTAGEGTADTDGTRVLAVTLVHVHDWNAWTVKAEPTCGAAGELVRTCKDGDSTQTHAVKATGLHVDDGGVVTRDATLYEEGEITHSCSTCGAVLSTEPISKLTEAVEYAIVLNPDGVWKQGTSAGAGAGGIGGGYAFSSAADFTKFLDVLVDGCVLDRVNYTVVSGSTKVTLHEDYLITLAAGVHEAIIRSTDGDAATTFTVAAAQDAEGDEDQDPVDEDEPGNEGKPDGDGKPIGGDDPAPVPGPAEGDKPVGEDDPVPDPAPGIHGPGVNEPVVQVKAAPQNAAPSSETGEEGGLDSPLPQTSDSAILFVLLILAFLSSLLLVTCAIYPRTPWVVRGFTETTK